MHKYVSVSRTLLAKQTSRNKDGNTVTLTVVDQEQWTNQNGRREPRGRIDNGRFLNLETETLNPREATKLQSIVAHCASLPAECKK